MQEAAARQDAPAPPAQMARRPIRALPRHVVNQIAAGEVVERPASVVKELLDNALDAGASRIRIELERGGLDLIRVTDDGVGIPADELEAALAPHATSKIERPEDLASVATLGFRGEALASIASVSRLTIRSRARDADAACEIAQEGDQQRGPRPASGPVGTSATVRDLFFNAPARRAFLRAPATEQSRCLDAVRDLATAHPLVGFSCVCDGRDALDLPTDQSLKERALALAGEELARDLIEVHADSDQTGGVSLWGLVGSPAAARSTTRWQRFFVNGRPVRDSTLAHALAEAYRGLIEPAKRPVALLLLEIDPCAVDVNVHPAKAEVRFHEPGRAHAAVLRAVRETLAHADLTPRWRDVRSARIGAAAESVEAAEFVDRFREKGLAPSPGPARLDYESLRSAIEASALPAAEPSAAFHDAAPRALPTPRPADPVLQVHNSYLVTQDESGVVIIDQHALHERVMFETLLERVQNGPLEGQRLLAPAVFSAPEEQIARLPALEALFERLGIEAGAIGPAEVAVHVFPTLLFDRKVEPAPFVADLLERACADDFPADAEEALREILDMMACKAAIKAGERLSDEEMGALLERRDSVERASNCPHGRPTAIRLTIRDLERRFGRS